MIGMQRVLVGVRPMAESVSLMDLVGQVTGWQAGRGTLYHRLAAALRRAMDVGTLPRGVRLPAERALAEALGVSRTTVVNAYDLLRDQGVLRSHRGSGTFIGHTQQAWTPSDPTAPTSVGTTLFRLRDEPADMIDLSLACLAGLDGIPPHLLSLSAADYGVPGLERGYAPLGYEPLRRAVAQHFDKTGLPTRPNQILITSGAQQAIALAAATLVSPGEAVAIESPTYPGAIDAFTKAGARLIPVCARTHPRIDDEGLRPDLLREVIARTHPRVLYVQPTFHNPTGLVMSEDHRRAVARLCDEADVAVVEDYTVGDLSLGRVDAGPNSVAGRVPQIARFVATAPSIVVGSTSKIFWSGLRVGWIRADEAMLMRFAHAKITADLGTSLPAQLVTLKLLSYYDDLKDVRRAQLTPRVELTARIFRERLPEWEWAMPKGGVTFWVRLPHGDSAEFARTAMRYGVFVLPGDAASPDKSHGRWIRVACGVEPARLQQGLERLVEAWKSYRPDAGGVSPHVAVCV
jgi:DNA-binding transcriptional MocR family regulator